MRALLQKISTFQRGMSDIKLNYIQTKQILRVNCLYGIFVNLMRMSVIFFLVTNQYHSALEYKNIMFSKYWFRFKNACFHLWIVQFAPLIRRILYCQYTLYHRHRRSVFKDNRVIFNFLFYFNGFSRLRSVS